MTVYEFIYKFRPDGDRWREQIKSYICKDVDDYHRADKIFTENPTEYELVNIIPHTI